MASSFEIILSMAVFLLVLLGGMWIPFALATASIILIYASFGLNGIKGIGIVAWNASDNFKLTAVPLFILMSDLLLRSGIGTRVYRGLSTVVRRLPGGLLQTNVVGSAIFAAVSGSSTATAAAIGTVAMPQMRDFGYDDRIATGSLAAGGTLGILIPPSIAFIIYGSFTDTSIASLFVAGIVPGLVLTGFFMVYIGIATSVSPRLLPEKQENPAKPPASQVILDLVPFTILIVGVLGGIYTGIVTPTEAAALGAGLAIVIGATVGELNIKTLYASLDATVRMTGGVMFIVVAAYLFGYASGIAGVPNLLKSALADLNLGKFEFLALTIVFFLILGMMMDGVGLMVITVPLLYPLLSNYGIDPLWFGVFVVILVEVGMITPPFGMNLFVLQAIRGRGRLEDIAFGVLPFCLIMLAMAVLLIGLPGLATWLPQLMR